MWNILIKRYICIIIIIIIIIVISEYQQKAPHRGDFLAMSMYAISLLQQIMRLYDSN